MHSIHPLAFFQFPNLKIFCNRNLINQLKFYVSLHNFAIFLDHKIININIFTSKKRLNKKESWYPKFNWLSFKNPLL